MPQHRRRHVALLLIHTSGKVLHGSGVEVGRRLLVCEHVPVRRDRLATFAIVHCIHFVIVVWRVAVSLRRVFVLDQLHDLLISIAAVAHCATVLPVWERNHGAHYVVTELCLVLLRQCSRHYGAMLLHGILDLLLCVLVPLLCIHTNPSTPLYTLCSWRAEHAVA